MTSLIHRCVDSARARVTPPPAPAVPSPSPSAHNPYFSQDAHDRCARLHPRQRDVLTLLSKGLDQREIAAAMGISANTVREHKQNVFKALEVNSAVEAAVLAAKAGLV